MTAASGEFAEGWRLSSIGSLVGYARRHPVGRRSPLRTAARILKWQIKSRLHSGPFVEPWIAGLRLSVSRGMTGATGNLYFGLHEFADMAFLLHLLREDDWFFDVGANVGTYSLLAAGACGARCWAFEPAAETRPLLEENVRLNGLGGRVRIMNCALGDRDGTIAFSKGEDAINRVVGPDHEGETQTVEVRRLDELARNSEPLMLKIDVEGFEESVLHGAEQTLAKPSLRAIEIETVTDAIAALLQRHSFAERWYDPFSHKLSAEPIDNGAHNSLFVRDEALVAERLRSALRFDIAGIAI